MTVDEQVQAKPYVGWVEVPWFFKQDMYIRDFIEGAFREEVDLRRFLLRQDYGIIELRNHSKRSGYIVAFGNDEDFEELHNIDNDLIENANFSTDGYWVHDAKKGVIKWELREAA